MDSKVCILEGATGEGCCVATAALKRSNSMSSTDPTYRSRAVRALLLLHDEHLRRFLGVWKLRTSRFRRAAED